MITRMFVIGLLPFVLIACEDNTNTVLPKPTALTAEAVSHYCQMNVLDHPGPKAQIHLDGHIHPLFFAQVRDAIAYQRMPEQPAQIKVIYVTDMGKAKSWEQPGKDNWIAATSAYYVIDSRRRGGMGAPELVPFTVRQDAIGFATQYGGTVIDYSGITDAMVLAPVEIKLPPPSEGDAHGLRGKPLEGSG